MAVARMDMMQATIDALRGPWKQAWARYEADHEVTLGVDLNLCALMKMLPAKESDVIKLTYVENEAGLTYDGFRQQVEF